MQKHLIKKDERKRLCSRCSPYFSFKLELSEKEKKGLEEENKSLKGEIEKINEEKRELLILVEEIKDKMN